VESLPRRTLNCCALASLVDTTDLPDLPVDGDEEALKACTTRVKVSDTFGSRLLRALDRELVKQKIPCGQDAKQTSHESVPGHERAQGGRVDAESVKERGPCPLHQYSVKNSPNIVEARGGHVLDLSELTEVWSSFKALLLLSSEPTWL
jgi:hypothetical protein